MNFGRMFRAIKIVALVSCMTGCQTVYLTKEPSLSGFDEIHTSDARILVHLECEYYTRGKRSRRYEKALREEVLSVLESTRVFTVSSDCDEDSLPVLKVVLQNETGFADRCIAVASYNFLSIPSCGLIGTHFEQPARATISLVWPEGATVAGEYSQQVHTYGGRHNPPTDCRKVSKRQLSEELTEDMLLTFLREFQSHSPPVSLPTN